MRQTLLIILLLFIINSGNAQVVKKLTQSEQTKTGVKSFQSGERLKFRIHYGFFNAGYATLNLEQSKKQEQSLYHAVGEGWTVGAASLFFKVQDRYESYFTKDEVKPIRFIRRVNEGGYIIRRNMYFNHQTNSVIIDDLEKNTQKKMSVGDVQDMLSAFYYLRNLDLDKIKTGDEIAIDLFFDSEMYPFKLKFLKNEIIKTKFGKIKTWKIRPIVQKGRVFEENESLTIWITDDDNKIPIRIKAALAVGSLKADLIEFKDLVSPFIFI